MLGLFIGKSMRKVKREQEGVMHVYFRGNGRYTVFYDDEDNLELLRRMDKFAKKFGSKVYDFALMGNHAHFLIETHSVTELMTEVLKSYSRWYNTKYKNSNKIFATPFSSACKHTENWVLETCAYILQNPVKAGMCGKVEYHRWNSAAFHFKDEQKHYYIGKAHFQLLSNIIELDTSFVDKYFENYSEFLKFANYNPVLLSSILPNNAMWETSTMQRINAEINVVLDGRIVNNLKKDELAELIIDVAKRTNCRMSQIASLLHVDYSFVKECFAKNGRNIKDINGAPQAE